jgi:hypothetical protein
MNDLINNFLHHLVTSAFLGSSILSHSSQNISTLTGGLRLSLVIPVSVPIYVMLYECYHSWKHYYFIISDKITCAAHQYFFFPLSLVWRDFWGLSLHPPELGTPNPTSVFRSLKLNLSHYTPR